jgi:hypothetical protein
MEMAFLTLSFYALVWVKDIAVVIKARILPPFKKIELLLRKFPEDTFGLPVVFLL